ncbi:Phosphoenolpyruvate/pyruvate domain-containing protein [Xylariaceae sp. FL1272]|nr:Phosphoenolpyruvate/pyruvate domain-containing protein [Xylariaceae sp. FL1272]
MSSNGTTAPQTPGSRLRALLADESAILVCPGVYDGFSARIVLNTGHFSALYMTGAGSTMSMLGTADLGLTTLTEMAANASMIAGLDPSVPLIADADTGFGGPLNIRRTTHAYARGGVAGFHIEDQVTTKRCGHLGGKELVAEDVFQARIRAAKLAREEIGSDIVIIARTDALASLGYDAAISRLRAAISAGADVAFLEAPQTREQMERVCKDLAPTPVLLNMVESGRTPAVTPEEARELGFRIMIFPVFTLGPVYTAIKGAAEELHKYGKVKSREGDGMGPKELFEVCGLKESVEFDERAGGAAYKNGV